MNKNISGNLMVEAAFAVPVLMFMMVASIGIMRLGFERFSLNIRSFDNARRASLQKVVDPSLKIEPLFVDSQASFPRPKRHFSLIDVQLEQPVPFKFLGETRTISSRALSLRVENAS